MSTWTERDVILDLTVVTYRTTKVDMYVDSQTNVRCDAALRGNDRAGSQRHFFANPTRGVHQNVDVAPNSTTRLWSSWGASLNQ